MLCLQRWSFHSVQQLLFLWSVHFRWECVGGRCCVPSPHFLLNKEKKSESSHKNGLKVSVRLAPLHYIAFPPSFWKEKQRSFISVPRITAVYTSLQTELGKIRTHKLYRRMLEPNRKTLLFIIKIITFVAVLCKWRIPTYSQGKSSIYLLCNN